MIGKVGTVFYWNFENYVHLHKTFKAVHLSTIGSTNYLWGKIWAQLTSFPENILIFHCSGMTDQGQKYTPFLLFYYCYLLKTISSKWTKKGGSPWVIKNVWLLFPAGSHGLRWSHQAQAPANERTLNTLQTTSRSWARVGPVGSSQLEWKQETEVSSHGFLIAGDFSKEKELSSQMFSFTEAMTQIREGSWRRGTTGELKEIEEQGPRARLAWALRDDRAARLWLGNLCEQGRPFGSASQALLTQGKKQPQWLKYRLFVFLKFCLFLDNQYIALNKTGLRSQSCKQPSSSMKRCQAESSKDKPRY